MVISLGPWAAGFDECIHSFLCVGGASFDEPGGAFPFVFAQRPCLPACPSWAVGTVCPGTLLPLRCWPSRVASLGGGCEFLHCSRDVRTNRGGFGRLAVELALCERALRPGANGRPPLITTKP
jgi:hypothetical protein